MENFSLSQKVLSGFLWLTTAAFITQAVSWLATIVVIRLLSPSDYGLLAMSGTFVFIITTISVLGINASLVQAKELSERDIRNIHGIVLTAVVICSLLCYGLAPFIASFYGEPRVTIIIRVLIFDFIFIALSLVPQSLAVREMNFKIKAKIDTYSQVLSSMLTLALAYFGMGVWSLVIGTMAMNFLKMIGFHLSVASPKIPLFHFREAKSFLIYGVTVTGDRLLYSFYNQIDNIIIGKILGDKLLGVYAVAINLASLPNNKILPIINQISFTSYSRIQDNRERLQRNVLRATRVVAGVSFPAFFGMAAIAPDLIPLLLGEQWVSATLPFQLLCLIMPLKALSTIYPPAVFALGEARVNLINMFITCVAMGISFFVGTHWGIMGVCAAWLIVFPLVLLFITNRCLKILGLRMKSVLAEIGFPLCASTLMFGALYLLHSVIGQLPVLAVLGSSIAMGAILYSLLVLLLYREKYYEILKLIRQ